MQVDSLEDLERLLDLCQRKQVHRMAVGGLSFELAVQPPEPPAAAQVPRQPSWDDDFDDDGSDFAALRAG